MVNIETGILDGIVQSYKNIFVGGIVTVQGHAISLFNILIVIDLVLAIILNLKDGDHMKILLTKIMKYGCWIWIINNYGMLIDVILDSLTMVGLSIGGGSLSAIKSPSDIFSQGLRLTLPYTDFINKVSGIEAFFSGATIIMALLGALGIITAFAIMAIQVAVTYIEFYIASTLLLIFIPFGVNKHFSFLAEKAVGAVFSYGVKLMVLGAILSVGIPIVTEWSLTLDQNPKFEPLFTSICACWMLAFLSWHGPGMAAGLMSGAPSLTAGTAIGTAAAAGAIAVGAGMVAKGAVSLGAKAAGGIASALSGGSKQGAVAAAAGAISEGSSGGAGGGSSNNGGSSGTQSVQSNNSVSSNEASTQSANEGTSQKSVGDAAGAKEHLQSNYSGSGKKNHSSGASSIDAMAIASKLKQGIPPEAQPQGGIHAPIKSDD